MSAVKGGADNAVDEDRFPDDGETSVRLALRQEDHVRQQQNVHLTPAATVHHQKVAGVDEMPVRSG